jgi:hypothetical protein
MTLADFGGLAEELGVDLRVIRRDLTMWEKLPFFGVEKGRTIVDEGPGRPKWTWRINRDMAPRMLPMPRVMALTKRCVTCDTVKPTTGPDAGFYSDRSRADRLQVSCKECNRQASRDRYYSDINKSRPEKRKTQAQHKRRLKRKHPDEGA